MREHVKLNYSINTPALMALEIASIALAVMKKSIKEPEKVYLPGDQRAKGDKLFGLL